MQLVLWILSIVFLMTIKGSNWWISWTATFFALVFVVASRTVGFSFTPRSDSANATTKTPNDGIDAIISSTFKTENVTKGQTTTKQTKNATTTANNTTTTAAAKATTPKTVVAMMTPTPKKSNPNIKLTTAVRFIFYIYRQKATFLFLVHTYIQYAWFCVCRLFPSQKV